MRPLSNAIHTVAQSALGKNWADFATLLAHWGEIVGRDMADHTTPGKLTFTGTKRDQGTLHILAPSAVTTLLQHQEYNIRQRVNGFFGFNAVARIIFDHKPAPPRLKAKPKRKGVVDEAGLQQATLEIADERLREILLSLGREVQAEENG